MKRYKVVIPWLLAQLGARKGLTDRGIHVPESVVESAAAEATKRAGVIITPVMWRAVEATQASMLYEGILVQVDDL